MTTYLDLSRGAGCSKVAPDYHGPRCALGDDLNCPPTMVAGGEQTVKGISSLAPQTRISYSGISLLSRSIERVLLKKMGVVRTRELWLGQVEGHLPAMTATPTVLP